MWMAHHLCDACVALKKGTEYPSFQDVGMRTFGVAGKLAVVLCMDIFMIGLCVIMLILFAQNTMRLWPVLTQSWWVLIYALLMIPFVWIRSMKLIGWLSSVGVLSIIATCIVIIIASVTNAVKEGDTLEYHLFNDQLGSAMATLMTSFGLTTMVSAVLNSVEEPKKFNKALVMAFAIVFTVYIGIMAAGYAGYGDQIAQYGDIVSAISTSTGKLNWAGYAIIICILVLCATHFLALFTPVAMDCERLIPEKAKFHRLLSYLIRTVLVAICALLATVVPGVMTLISILGAILGMPCVMLLPLFFYWKACFVDTAGIRAIYSGRVIHFIGEIIIILISIYTLVFGLYQTIINM
uniref:Amino acid transporter transmembrane domain-containing protein n=1 Tax=Oxyrrhis marina TaxID=2969 RepID=A0A7S3XKN1_OXYMA